MNRALSLFAGALATIVLSSYGCGGSEGEVGGGGASATGTASSTATTGTTGSGGNGGGGASSVSSSSSASSVSASSSSGSSSSASASSSSGMGGGPQGDFSCLGSVTWPLPQQPSVTATLTFGDLTSNAPISGGTAKACAKGDLNCTAPLAQGTTNASGDVVLTVPTGANGFDGYLDFLHPDYMPSTFYQNRPIADDVSQALVAVSKNTFNLFGILITPPNPARGHITFLALGCDDLGAAGVKISVDKADGQSTFAYVKGMFPDTNATETDESGSGIVANVLTGAALVTATVVGSNQVLGSHTVNIKAGAITTVVIWPAP